MKVLDKHYSTKYHIRRINHKTDSDNTSSRCQEKEQPNDKLLGKEYSLFTWKENDKAIVNFKSLKEIEGNHKNTQHNNRN